MTLAVVAAFLAVVLVYSSSSSPIIVFAAPPDQCFGSACSGLSTCDNNPEKLTATCCWRDPRDIPQYTKCQTCHVNTETGEFENCTDISSKGKSDSSVTAPPPSGVAPPSTTITCPEKTAVTI